MGGYHLVYTIYQSGIKQEMKSYLSTHKDPRFGTYLNFKLEKGKINNQNFEWEELNEEFSYNQEMYDVVNVQYTADSIRICAIKDTRENQLAQNLMGIHKQKQNNSSGSSLSVLKFFSIFIFDIQEERLFSQRSSILYATVIEHDFFSNAFDVQAPPPRC